MIGGRVVNVLGVSSNMVQVRSNQVRVSGVIDVNDHPGAKTQDAGSRDGDTKNQDAEQSYHV